MPNVPIVNAGLKYIWGMNLAWASNTTITVAAGACRDSTNTLDIEVADDTTVDFAVRGLNGLDAGSIGASTRYAVYAIANSNTGAAPAGYILSTNFTAPTLPFGYDSYRRIGMVLTSGASAVLLFWQYGKDQERTMYYDVAIQELAAGNATTYTAIDLATSVPPVACEVIALVAYTPASATNLAHFLPAGSSATNGIVRFGYGVAAAQVGMAKIPCRLSSGAPVIQYKVANGSDALTVSTAGYVDQL